MSKEYLATFALGGSLKSVVLCDTKEENLDMKGKLYFKN